MFDLNVGQDVPDFAMLWLPPFPSKSATAQALVPFSMYSQPGIFVRKHQQGGELVYTSSPLRRHGQDSGLRPLVDILQDHSPEARVSRQTNRLEKRLAEGGALVRIRAEDCLKIGDEHTSWQEPAGTANEGRFQEDASPFERLISATRDFLYSRSEEFQFHRSRRLFTIIRDSFGLRSDRKGDHWPAGVHTDDLQPQHEACCLLRNTDSAVRGFLALARREAEAGWDTEPSLKLCQLVAAFLSYVVHHKVFPEEPFASNFENAASLARTAPRLLRDSILVEDALADYKGWNAATWALWGGQYGSAARGSLQMGVWPVDSGTVLIDNVAPRADGGWGTETAISEKASTDEDPVEPYMADLLEPIAIESVKLLEYIPYARRRITKVLPPQPDARRPAYTSQLCCIVTVPSPWTEAEGWRRCPLAQSEHETDVPADVEDAGPLELEEATVEDPARLTIWIERSALGNDSTGQSLVGMALRGRWGLFGNASEGNRNQWWAFRSKNYVLPALWSRSEGEREVTDV